MGLACPRLRSARFDKGEQCQSRPRPTIPGTTFRRCPPNGHRGATLASEVVVLRLTWHPVLRFCYAASSHATKGDRESRYTPKRSRREASAWKLSAREG